MIYYCKKNAEGVIGAVGSVNAASQIPEGCEKCTKAERDEWLQEVAQRMEALAQAAEETPTAAEQLRADVDYIAAMTGVTL